VHVTQNVTSSRNWFHDHSSTSFSSQLTCVLMDPSWTGWKCTNLFEVYSLSILKKKCMHMYVCNQFNVSCLSFIVIQMEKRSKNVLVSLLYGYLWPLMICMTSSTVFLARWTMILILSYGLVEQCWSIGINFVLCIWML